VRERVLGRLTRRDGAVEVPIELVVHSHGRSVIDRTGQRQCSSVACRRPPKPRIRTADLGRLARHQSSAGSVDGTRIFMASARSTPLGRANAMFDPPRAENQRAANPR
jgi:hypothetical protein